MGYNRYSRTRMAVGGTAAPNDMVFTPTTARQGMATGGLTASQQATFNDMTQNYGMSPSQALMAMGQSGATTVSQATSGSSSSGSSSSGGGGGSSASSGGGGGSSSSSSSGSSSASSAAKTTTSNTTAASTPTLTQAQANDLMYRSMTTGVSTAEMNAAGGYEAVKAMYEAGGGGYSMSEIPTNLTLDLAKTQASNGYGNAAVGSAATVINVVRDLTGMDPTPEIIAEYQDLITLGETDSSGLKSIFQNDPSILENKLVDVPEGAYTYGTDFFQQGSVSSASDFNTVNQLYQEVFGRPVGQEGADFYVPLLTSGAITPERLRSVLQDSPEGRAVAANNVTPTSDQRSDPNYNTLDQLYQEVLNRPVGQNGAAFYLPMLESGELTPDSLRSILENSPEAKALSNTPVTPVTDAQKSSPNYSVLDQLYQEVFGRPVGEEGAGFYLPLLESGELTPDSLRKILQDSPEAKSLAAAEEIKDTESYKLLEQLYKEELGIPVDPNVASFYTPLLESGDITVDQLRTILKTSPTGMGYSPITTLMETQAGLNGEPTALPAGTEYTPELQQVQADELLDRDSVVLGDVTETAAQVSTEGLEVPTPTKTAAATYEAYTQPGTPEAIAAQGKLSAESIVGDIQGVVSQQSIAEAAQGEVSDKATVQYQLGELFKSFEEGSPPPAWAAPAVRQIGAIMTKRGLGASSMAAAATMQAVMESGIPIAQADAQTYAAMDIANLNARQQAALQNAATYAAMDRANLDARMQAAITNAQSFLAMDTANLSNQQRANELTHQAEVQKMTNDQAAINAAAQFNAKSQNEVDQFFAELEVQVENANMNRLAAQEQFNVNQVNAMTQFNASMNDARERFEVQMQAQIDASNAAWRREINTANTATQNAANQINAQNLLNLTATAQANLWQRYRDESAWIFQMSESALNRQHQIATMNLTFAEDQARYDQALADQTAADLGKMAYNVIFG